MKNTNRLLSILLLLVCVVMQKAEAQRMFVQLGSQVEITEVKNIGVSAADQTRSIIEIRWQTKFAPNMYVKSFDIKLEVTYADGSVVTAQSSVTGTARSGRVEVPTTNSSAGGRPPSAIKSFRASVTTTFTETTTKQFPS